MGPRILQLGKTGQLARETISAAQRSDISLTAVAREDVDFCRPDEIIRLVSEADVDVVVNTVAYTAVDKAESEAELAQSVNGDAVGVLAKACAARHLPLIHISTDYVFDGEKNSPYCETDETNPLSVYGKTKLAGERYIQNVHDKYVIIRTSWVYSPHNNNFLSTMLRLGAERDILRVVADQHGAPTVAADIAQCVLRIARQLHRRGHGPSGIFHYTGAGETTWYGFAKAISKEAKSFSSFKAAIQPIPTADYPTPARRPKNSRLDCRRIKEDYGIETNDWRGSLSKVIDVLKSSKGNER